MSEVVVASQQKLVGKYKPYSEYRDSGIVWFGKVPIAWSWTALKRVVSAERPITYGIVQAGPNIEDGIPYVRPTDMTDEDGIKEGIELLKTSDEIAKSYRRSMVDSGDIICSIGPSFGKLMIVPDSLRGANLTQGTARIAIAINHDTRYFFWCLRSLSSYQQWESSIGGATFRALNLGPLADTLVPLPPVKEQSLIAAFLDYETARIDRLIAKQQRLIELLKEKRQAVISHAVTKGLNPDAPMKDSGVEWLGQVPEHWNVTKFGFISNVVRGGSPRPAGDPELFDGDYSPWVTVAEITKDEEVYLESTESFLTEKGSKQSRVFKRGTLLLSNSGATLGVPKILSIDANANDGVVGFEKLSVNTEYAYFYLSTLTDNLRERIKQGSGQPNLNTDIVKSIVIPLPPSGEVEAILSEIKTHRITFSVLISKADTAIKLMQERRTALISAAVTGKIDLRGWTPPAEEAAA
ncbi:MULTISPECIES: restriction endonuclease subunit S [Aeromonas]|uniref:restriction endonuclease subunit S n=1 Tax=Aeromonas TaxID=642 RepID=UPI00191F7C3B|nr:restriction endonuclease subunit S [Aeromonas caviae]HEB4993521.1 restriction endonuclease subunit S [Aeromonas hydrophila subsp. hydrophila]MBL0585638.1 restriction endonuclease subunit S [Aeromonas caviae]MDX7816650.1 restriction endonuclease subunit S [Aeromonas caviae]USP64157.1 restriction endonuclease subunit S [Aeromonas caviae]BDA18018.1 type I restriction-modification protein subunit S [Aeromonas caviae]